MFNEQNWRLRQRTEQKGEVSKLGLGKRYVPLPCPTQPRRCDLATWHDLRSYRAEIARQSNWC